MSRRRRKQPVSLLTAVFVEVGTVIGMVAVAQPTWTLGIIESVGKSSAVSQVVSSQVISPQIVNPQMVTAEPPFARVHDGYVGSWHSVQNSYPQLVIPPRLGSVATQGSNSSYSSYGSNF